jgi:hypothetical protein
MPASTYDEYSPAEAQADSDEEKQRATAEAAKRYADYAAINDVERFCTRRKDGWWDYGICGPLVSPALNYLRACERLEWRKVRSGDVFRVRDDS